MTGTHDPPETTPDEELPDEDEGAVDGELSDELELLELEESLELEVPPADDVFAPLECCVVLVPAPELWLVLVEEPDAEWCVPAAAAATPPVRTAAPRAMPRVARRIIFRPRARRCGPDRGTGARRLRSSEAGLR
jgi:hypothetical protein